MNKEAPISRFHSHPKIHHLTCQNRKSELNDCKSIYLFDFSLVIFVMSKAPRFSWDYCLESKYPMFQQQYLPFITQLIPTLAADSDKHRLYHHLPLQYHRNSFGARFFRFYFPGASPVFMLNVNTICYWLTVSSLCPRELTLNIHDLLIHREQRAVIGVYR